MSQLTLRAIRAKNGDSLLLFAPGATVLIDGGPSGVYKQNLKDQLRALDHKNNVPPQIDLMMVSHIDEDHIVGILDLTSELLEAQEDDREPIVTIKNAWHNSFSDLIASVSEQSSSEISASAAKVASVFETLKSEAFSPHDSKMVLESVKQGRNLRLDLKALNIRMNRCFKDNIVLQGNTEPWVCGELKLSVVGPTQRELDKLRERWQKDLKKILESEAALATTSALSLDTSVPNLASIVAIAEVADKSILLTGDARGDMILKWLEETGRLASGETIHFNMIKLPHHGSDRNITAEFFERVTADHYVISGDGKHGNPEPNTFEMLFTARPCLSYNIHLTYGPEELKLHPKYIHDGNVAKLDAVLSDPKRLETLCFPAQGGAYIDVVI